VTSSGVEGDRAAITRGTARSLVAGVFVVVNLTLIALWSSVASTLPDLRGLVVASIAVLAVGIVCLVGVIVLDIGAQLTQVGNQTRIFGLVPSARSRLNTVYMTVYFSGAAAGSALSTVAWVRWQWDGVCGMALVLIAGAGLLHVLGVRAHETGLAGTQVEADTVLEV